jgi:hypothetical protein
MFVDDAPLKNARASWPFCRGSRQPASPAVQKSLRRAPEPYNNGWQFESARLSIFSARELT